MSEPGAAILGRLEELESATLSAEAARSILRLDFSKEVDERVLALTYQAQDNMLTDPERAELEAYIGIAERLALAKSKARLSLKRIGVRV